MDAAEPKFAHQSPYHFLLAKEYWTLRMEEEESWSSFKRRATRYERELGYSNKFDQFPDRRKVDMWLGRLSKRFAERVQVRTNDFLDLENTQDLFDVLERIEVADARLENASAVWQDSPVTTLEVAPDFKDDLERFPRNHSWLFNNRSKREQYPIDALLARFPPNLLAVFRQWSNNFEHIGGWKDVPAEYRRFYYEKVALVPDEYLDHALKYSSDAKWNEGQERVSKKDKQAMKAILKWKAGVENDADLGKYIHRHVAHHEVAEWEAEEEANTALKTSYFAGYRLQDGNNKPRCKCPFCVALYDDTENENTESDDIEDDEDFFFSEPAPHADICACPTCVVQEANCRTAKEKSAVKTATKGPGATTKQSATKPAKVPTASMGLGRVKPTRPPPPAGSSSNANGNKSSANADVNLPIREGGGRGGKSRSRRTNGQTNGRQ